jgi:hypothetical protein
MIKNILGVFIALSILGCAVFSPQYLTIIVALPFIYFILKRFSHHFFIQKHLFFISLLVFLLVFTLNYTIINHTNIVVRHDVQTFVITSENACVQKTKEISLIILCNEKPFFDFENSTYTPLPKSSKFSVISVDSDSNNFNHSVIVKMQDNKQNISFIQIKNDEIGQFQVKEIPQSITNDFLIQMSYIAAIPVAFAFIAALSYLFLL